MTQAIKRLAAATVWMCAISCSTAAPPDSGGDAAAGDAAIDELDAAVAVTDAAVAVIDGGPLPPQTTRLRIINRCSEPIWMAHSANVPFPQNLRLDPGQFHDYAIAASGLASARFWPKTGCDASGHACRIGDSGEGGGAPCGPGGCQPPIDSKFEATFAAVGSAAATFYNLSLVDGFTLPFSVTPVGAGAGQGSCTTSDCSGLRLDVCPAHEALIDRDLRVRDPGNAGRTIACLSPCKAWNYPAPYGLGRAESKDPGRHMCCPAPMTPEACRNAADPLSVVHTSYVAAVHAGCPTAYSYSYDDAAGLHACPSSTAFAVTFCG